MPFAELYKNIFEKEGPGNDSAALLKELVKEYPYFSLAHFYLLQQTPDSAAGYDAVAAKTALHFNNPYYLQSQLKAATFRENKIEILDESNSDGEALTPEVKANNLEQDSLYAGLKSAENINTEEPVSPAETPPKSDAGTEREATAQVPAHEEQQAVDAEQQQTGIEEDHSFKYVPINLPAEELPVISNDTETMPAQNDIAPVPVNNEEKAIAVPAADNEELLQPESKHAAKDEEFTEENNTTPAQAQPAENIVSQSVGAQPAGPAAASMLFEPLHATDYFASQGIKLREEVAPADKLGKQLKSFTEWLKTMKKVHDTGTESAPNLDMSVQTLAEKSNREEEVITEAMADVYIQQGKAKKAREVYQKLSLLNPAKSAYFAAKIDQIK